MVELYYTLIKVGRRSIDQVPERYRAEVQALLEPSE